MAVDYSKAAVQAAREFQVHSQARLCGEVYLEDVHANPTHLRCVLMRIIVGVDVKHVHVHMI